MSYTTQGSQDWHEWRRSKITASRVAAIMNQDPWKSPLDIYNEMVEGKSQNDNAAMRRGRDLESMARRAYEEYTGIAVEPAVINHPTCSWLGASLDGVSFAHDYIVEIKCPGDSSYDKMKKDGIPRHYWIQIQTQLFCVPEAKEAHFFVFQGADFFIETIKPDNEFHLDIKQATEKFFLDHIIQKVPPSSKYIKINDSHYLELEKSLFDIMEISRKLNAEEANIKRQMIEIANERTVEGLLTRVNNATRKGSIDESKLSEMGVNVDQCRKPSKIYQTVSFF